MKFSTVMVLSALAVLAMGAFATPGLAQQQCNCISFEADATLQGTPQDAYGGSNGFYGIQLLNNGGGNYTIHVSDRTYDANAYGSIVVTDCATGAVIVNQSFDSTIGDFDNPASIDVPVVIAAQSFSVTLTTQEFSGSSLWFGDDKVTVGNPPLSQLNTETRCYFACGCDTFASAADLGGSPKDAYGGSNGFYGIQLINEGGGNYTVHVSDRTYDANAYGSIVVTDCETGAQVLSQNFDSSIGDFDNPASIDVPVVIGATYFSVTLTTQEFSGSSVWFGDDKVTVGNPPLSQLNTVTRCYIAADPPVAVEATTWGTLKQKY